MSKDITRTEIKQMIKDEFDKKFNQIFVDSLVKELKKVNSPARKEMVDTIKKAMVTVHKFMWMRREVWLNEIK